jgi:alpha-mannosidase
MTDRRTLHMVGNAHLDAVWLWPWEEGYAEVRATFRSALDRMDEDPDFLFACDSVAYYAWLEDLDPELFERIRRRVGEGRWEPTGGWWVEPDCNLPGGESLVRQGLYGQHYLRSRFGRIATVGMNVDPFGHAGSLPQILAKQGLAAYVFFRPLAHEKLLPGPVFRWRSPDGSEVLASRIPHEYSSGLGVDDIGPHALDAVAAIPGAWTDAMCFFGVGNHGGGPTRANIASVHRLAAAPDGPRVVFSTPERFFARVVATTSRTDLPLVEDELQHHAVGCYSAMSEVKALNRRAERELLTAEAWAAVAERRFALPYPLAELGHAWRQLNFNQFHDILAGTAIESAYVAVRDQVGESLAIAGRALNRSTQAVASRVAIDQVDGTSPLLVFNPLAWPVQAIAEVEFGAFDGPTGLSDAAGRPVAVQVVRSEGTAPRRRRLVFKADLPALGYRLYRVRPATEADASARPAPVTVVPTGHGFVIDNGRVRAVIDADTGWLAEIADLASGAVIRTPPEARHAEVIEDPSDTWAHGVEAFGGAADAFRVTSVRVMETGPVRVAVRVESACGESRLREDLLLSDGAPYVEVRALLDWHERQRVLKLRIPTALHSVVATFEIPYGTVRREPSGHEEPGQTWVDVSGMTPDGTTAGVSLVTDSKSAYDIRGGTIGITAARSAVFAQHEPITRDPDADDAYQDQGRMAFRYAVLPHGGRWRDAATPYHAAVFNRRPIPLLESAHPGVLPPAATFAGSGSPAVGLTALKAAEDGGGDLILRVVELNGLETTTVIELPFVGRSIPVSLAPHEIRSLRVPVDAAAPAAEVNLLEDPLVERA